MTFSAPPVTAVICYKIARSVPDTGRHPLFLTDDSCHFYNLITETFYVENLGETVGQYYYYT